MDLSLYPSRIEGRLHRSNDTDAEEVQMEMRTYEDIYLHISPFLNASNITLKESRYQQRVCTKLKRLLLQNSDSWKGTEKANNWRSWKGFRITIVGTPAVLRIPPQAVNQEVSVEVKLRITSNYHPEAPVILKEQCLLSKLARVLGPENVKLKIKLRRGNHRFPGLETASQDADECIWSEENFWWEGKTVFKFLSGSRDANILNNNLSLVESIRLTMNTTALCKILQENTSTLLEGRNRAIMKLLEENNAIGNMTIAGSNGVSISCHKMLICNASPVFAAMLNPTTDGFKESKSLEVRIADMSEEGVVAMLRYIYFLNIEGICEDSELAVELLFAAHVYLMSDLAETIIILLMVQRRDWFSVDAAVELMCFARNLEGHAQEWRDLKEKSALVLQGFVEEGRDLKTSPKWMEIAQRHYQTAMVLRRPEFVNNIFEGYCDAGVEESLSSLEVSTQDVEELAEFLGQFFCRRISENVDIAVEMLKLIQKCVVDHPTSNILKGVDDDLRQMILMKPNEWWNVDAAVDLFCFARELENDQKWTNVKLKMAGILKWFLLQRPLEAQASVKYNQLFQTNQRAAMELSTLFVYV